MMMHELRDKTKMVDYEKSLLNAEADFEETQMLIERYRVQIKQQIDKDGDFIDVHKINLLKKMWEHQLETIDEASNLKCKEMMMKRKNSLKLFGTV